MMTRIRKHAMTARKRAGPKRPGLNSVAGVMARDTRVTRMGSKNGKPWIPHTLCTHGYMAYENVSNVFGVSSILA
jgi:hypothetical protein